MIHALTDFSGGFALPSPGTPNICLDRQAFWVLRSKVGEVVPSKSFSGLEGKQPTSYIKVPKLSLSGIESDLSDDTKEGNLKNSSDSYSHFQRPSQRLASRPATSDSKSLR